MRRVRRATGSSARSPSLAAGRPSRTRAADPQGERGARSFARARARIFPRALGSYRATPRPADPRKSARAPRRRAAEPRARTPQAPGPLHKSTTISITTPHERRAGETLTDSRPCISSRKMRESSHLYEEVLDVVRCKHHWRSGAVAQQHHALRVCGVGAESPDPAVPEPAADAKQAAVAEQAHRTAQSLRFAGHG